MSKLEKEIKILNINKNELYKKLEDIKAEFIETKKQKIYTYDLPTIYSRYIEILELLKTNSNLINKNAISKLNILLDEFSDLIDDKVLSNIYKEMYINSFNDLYELDKDKLINILNSSKTFNNEIKNKLINPNKWIRLRKSNDKVELTVKHVYDKNNNNIQRVMEYEINVNDFDETNKLLNSIGVVRRNYQEKIRHSFKYKSAYIEIDEWPLINPYLEIECDDESIIYEIVNLLGYNICDIVSINTEEIYRNKNINIKEIADLKF